MLQNRARQLALRSEYVAKRDSVKDGRSLRRAQERYEKQELLIRERLHHAKRRMAAAEAAAAAAAAGQEESGGGDYTAGYRDPEAYSSCANSAFPEKPAELVTHTQVRLRNVLFVTAC
jgi:hypothetical protein